MIGEFVARIVEGRSALELALVAVALVILPAMSVYFGLRGNRRAPAPRELLSRYFQTMLRGWLIAAATLAAWKASGRPFAELGLAWPPGTGGQIGLAFAAAGALALLYSATFGFRLKDSELARWKERLDALKIAPRTFGEFAAFTPVAITAGVWEELFYRGFLMWFFAPIGGIAGAAVISSAIFGLGHAYQGLAGVLRTTLAGLVFAAFYWATGSLWWLMILHAAVDVFAGLLAFRVYAASRKRKKA